MTQRTVTWILAVHLVLVWTAVILRIDRFPLTWAPMYAVYVPPTTPEYHLRHRDKKWLKDKGWLATRRDGSTNWIRQGDLNVPSRAMWRNYYQRTYGKGPPKYNQLNRDAGTFDRWLWGLEPGEPYVEIDWQRRLLVSINKTLGLEPADPEFIVSLEAKAKRYLFDRATLEYRGTEANDALAVWDERWQGDF